MNDANEMTMMLANKRMASRTQVGAPPKSSASLRAVWMKHESAAMADAFCCERTDAYADHLERALPAVLAAFIMLHKHKKD
jgi:hypothetical protein